MRRFLLVLIASVLASSSSFASERLLDSHHPVLSGEFDPEMTGEEYRQAFEELSTKGTLPLYDPSELQDILDIGKRNLEWLEVLNQARPSNQRLELSSRETQGGIPIDAAKESNATIVRAEFNTFKNSVPSVLLQVLQSNGTYPQSLPVDDLTYIKWARKADHAYQGASRWVLQKPYLMGYALRSRNDIRGYYFLSKEPDLDRKLRGWTGLDAATRTRLTPWLLGMCHNSGAKLDLCARLFKARVKKDGDAFAYYSTYRQDGKAKYDSFFTVVNPRRDASWGPANSNVFSILFKNPQDLEIQDWLRDNIEDEWRFGAWNLRLDFRTSGKDLPYVAFVAGATPNVNGLGGSRITMDANRSIHEYTSEWTIRHEFGHVLGLPDCYVEYYDTGRRVMVNYQVDIDNLMCSRRGHILQSHVDALQAAYFKN